MIVPPQDEAYSGLYLRARMGCAGRAVAPAGRRLFCRKRALFGRRMGRTQPENEKGDCIRGPESAFCPPLSGRSVAWLARLFRVQEVVSSNLTAPTIFLP